MAFKVCTAEEGFDRKRAPQATFAGALLALYRSHRERPRRIGSISGPYGCGSGWGQHRGAPG